MVRVKEMSNLVYNGAWDVTMSNLPQILRTNNGVLTGNGKIAMYVSMEDVGTTQVLTSGSVQFDKIGQYKNNTINVFRTQDASFTMQSYSNGILPLLQHQTLKMDCGHVDTRFILMSNSNPVLDITHTLIPLRQYPYCTLHTISVSTTSIFSDSVLDIYHHIKAPSSPLHNIQYNNNSIYNEQISGDQGVYMLLGSGYDPMYKCDVAAGSCYLFPSSLANSIVPIGFNIYNDKSMAYQKLRLSSVTSNQTYTFHILSAVMTSMDFEDPIEEIKRIILNIVFKESTVDNLVQRMISDNKSAWQNMWKGDVEVMPRMALSSDNMMSVMQVRRFTRQCLFNIYACIREAVKTEVNPLKLSYIDTNGNIFFDGDLWLLPLLLILKPNIAKTILEHKYLLLEQATQLAASFGHSGSKYPYKQDALGYKTVYWDIVSPLHIFNNANIVVNVWNYYRVTQNLQWLTSKGYPMMKNVMDFLISCCEKQTDGTYIISNICGLGAKVCNNHAFTVNMILMAIASVQQACNVLSYTYDPQWNIVANGLLLPLTVSTDAPGPNIIKYDMDYLGSMEVDVVDNLISLLPLFNSVYYRNDGVRDQSDALRNIIYYVPRIDIHHQQHPVNNLISLGIYGRISQTFQAQLSMFSEYINRIFTNNVVGEWGVMNVNNNVVLGNDVSLNALFVLMILTCVCQIKVKGSTNPSNTLIESYGLNLAELSSGVYMPYSWASVTLRASQMKMIYNVKSTP